MNIGSKIKQLREERGYSTTQLGKKTGLAQSTISEIENNRLSPSMKTLEKICSALGLTVPEFFASEVQELDPQIRRLINSAQSLTPSQLKALDSFLASMNQSQGKTAPKVDLGTLLPKNEKSLGDAFIKIRSIVEKNELSDAQWSELNRKAVKFYGVPKEEGEAAEHRSHSPGKIPMQTSPLKK